MERKYARHQVLQSSDFTETIQEIKPLLKGYRYAMIGGLAVAYYSNPPVTIDIDFIIEGSRKDLSDLIDVFEDNGWEESRLMFANNMKGHFKSGSTFNRSEPISAQLDFLFTLNDKFLDGVLDRARGVSVNKKVSIPVITIDDLILLKMMAGRDKDHSDIQELQKSRGKDIDWDYIEEQREELGI